METIKSLDLPVIKIASPDIVNWPLLHDAARTGLPLIISTGAANLNEIASSVAWLRGWNARFALLHCISSYPTPVEQANLCWIGEAAPNASAFPWASPITQPKPSPAHWPSPRAR